MSHSPGRYLYEIRPIFDASALYADMTQDYVSPMEPGAGEIVTLRFRTAKYNVDAVYLRWQEQRQKMSFWESDEHFDYYQVQLHLSDNAISYYFEVDSGRLSVIYDRQGIRRGNRDVADFTLIPGFQTPEWIKGAVMYQIYTDRFCNGNPYNDVLTREYFYIDD